MKYRLLDEETLGQMIDFLDTIQIEASKGKYKDDMDKINMCSYLISEIFRVFTIPLSLTGIDARFITISPFFANPFLFTMSFTFVGFSLKMDFIYYSNSFFSNSFNKALFFAKIVF